MSLNASAAPGREFRMPASMRFKAWLSLIGLVGFDIGILVCVLVPQWNPDPNGLHPFWVYLLLLPMTALMPYAIVWSGRRIQVDAAGIRLVPRWGQPQSLDWGDVRRICDRPVMQQLDLHGPAGELITFPYLIEGYLELRRIVFERSRNLEPAAPDDPGRPLVFRCWTSVTVITICAVMLIASAIDFAARGDPCLPILVAILAGIFLFAGDIGPHTLVVDAQEFRVYGLRRRRIPFADVDRVWTSMDIAEQHGVPAGAFFHVVLRLRDQREVTLNFTFDGGAELACQRIVDRIERSRCEERRS